MSPKRNRGKWSTEAWMDEVLADRLVHKHTLDQYLVTLSSGEQVLVDCFDSGTVEVSVRPHEGGAWLPLELTGGKVQVTRGVPA